MCTIDIGIRHDDDLVITKLRDIEVFVDAGTEGGDHTLDFFIRIYAVEACLLHIQYLTTERQHSLGMYISSILCRAQCRISLNDEDLALIRILRVTVDELARKTDTIERRLSSRKITGTTSRCTRTLSEYRLLADGTRYTRVLLEIVGELLTDDVLNRGLRLGISKLLLGLSLELRILDFDRNYGRETFTDIITTQIRLRVLQELMTACIIVKGLRDRVFKTGEVGSTLRGIDVIDEGIGILSIGVIMLHRDLDEHMIPLTLTVNDIRIQWLLALVEILHELLDTTLVVEGLFLLFTFTSIDQCNFQRLREEGCLTETNLQGIVIIYGIFEDLRIRKEVNLRSMLTLIALTDDGHRLYYLTALELHVVDLSALENGNLEPA